MESFCGLSLLILGKKPSDDKAEEQIPLAYLEGCKAKREYFFFSFLDFNLLAKL